MDVSGSSPSNCPSVAISKLIRQRQGLQDEPADDKKGAIAEVVTLALAQDSRAFAKARKHNRETIRLETPPARFLRYAKGDAKVAARMLNEYWELRKEECGKDMFARPLTMTGDGAFSIQDVQVFESGFFVILPPDNTGRPVVCFDRSRLENDYSVEDLWRLLPSVRRCVCYILSVISEKPITQQKGITLLQIYSSSFTNSSFDDSFQQAVREWLKVLPIPSDRLEVVCRPPRRENDFYMNETIPKLQRVLEKNHGENVSFTIESFTDRLLAAIEARGFKRDGIPSSTGGEWVLYKEFLRWRRERAVTERLIDASLSMDKAKAAEVVKDVMRQESRRKRKRIHDQNYARKKREEHRDTVQQLEDQVEQLRLTGRGLEAETVHLRKLLEEAKEQVRVIEDLREQGRLPQTLLAGTVPAPALPHGLVPGLQAPSFALAMEHLNPYGVGLPPSIMGQGIHNLGSPIITQPMFQAPVNPSSLTALLAASQGSVYAPPAVQNYGGHLAPMQQVNVETLLQRASLEARLNQNSARTLPGDNKTLLEQLFSNQFNGGKPPGM